MVMMTKLAAFVPLRQGRSQGHSPSCFDSTLAQHHRMSGRSPHWRIAQTWFSHMDLHKTDLICLGKRCRLQCLHIQPLMALVVKAACMGNMGNTTTSCYVQSLCLQQQMSLCTKSPWEEVRGVR